MSDFAPSLSGFLPGTILHAGRRSVVLRMTRDGQVSSAPSSVSEGTPVVVKTTRGEFVRPRDNARLKRELEVTSLVDHPGVLRHLAIIEEAGRVALVSQDFGAQSLAERHSLSPLTIEETLRCGREIADALGAIHAAGIIHKDLKPSNILVTPDLKRLQICDLGLASVTTREQQAIVSPEILSGTLLYIAPEQTGRMNRPVDLRADLYALGALLYELLVGHPPFEGDDPMELVHSHIARPPRPPDQLNTAVPHVVSRLVCKLLAKNPEDRYSGAIGVRHDLDLCVAALRDPRRLNAIELGKNDVPTRFVIPDRLYGRDVERARLVAAFDSVAEGRAGLLLVTGYSGIGKTSLIQEIHRPVTERRGYFSAGKFDQFRREAPYSALIDAIRGLTTQLLTEREERIRAWKTALLEAVGPNGQVIIDVVPEVEVIIGPQPAAAQLDPMGTLNRFNYVFRQFLRVFAQPAHPLVLFLDDLQWADNATLNLLESVSGDPEGGAMLILGAYRDNEVTHGHPLALTLARMAERGKAWDELHLGPLVVGDAANLIADTLAIPAGVANPLAELVHAKTGGNPFFLRLFLHALHRDGLITLDRAAGRWVWRSETIHEVPITDNVVDLALRRLAALDANSRCVLSVAAFLGSSVDMSLLAGLLSPPTDGRDLPSFSLSGSVITAPRGLEFAEARVSEACRAATADELGEVRLKQERIPADGSTGADPGLHVERRFIFAHDRIQQAAYSLIAEPDRPAIHLRIGRALRSSMTRPGHGGAASSDQLFMVTAHLNLGIGLIKEAAERADLASLNLRAGERALRSTAYGAAAAAYGTAISLFPDDIWTADYATAVAAYLQAAEAARLALDYETMDRLVRVVFARAQSPVDAALASQIQILRLSHEGKNLEAIAVGCDALQKLGVSIPRSAKLPSVFFDLFRTKRALKTTSVEALATASLMTGRRERVIMALFSEVVSAAYFASPLTMTVVVLRGVALSAKAGIAPESGFFFACYGMVLCGVLGDIEGGFPYGDLGISMARRFGGSGYECRTRFVRDSLCAHWKRPLEGLFDEQLLAYRVGMETGDIGYGTGSLLFVALHRFVSGSPLTELAAEIDGHIVVLRRHDMTRNLVPLLAIRQAVDDLRRGDASAPRLVGQHLDADAVLAVAIAEGDKMRAFWVRLFRAFCAYHFGDITQADADIRAAEPDLDAVVGQVLVPIFHAVDGLIAARLGRSALRRLTRRRKKLTLWAGTAPENYAHLADLLRAEEAALRGEDSQATDAFERAYARAVSAGRSCDGGLISERAAAYHESRGRSSVARHYSANAANAYVSWGAEVLVTRLRGARQPQLPAFSTGVASRGASMGSSVALFGLTTDDSGAGLDLRSVIEAAAAMSEEIVLGRLVGRLMDMVLKTAGADRAVLLQISHGRVTVDAEGVLEGDAVTVRTGAVAHGAEYPSTLVRLVERTRKPAIVDDVSKDTRLLADPYVVEHRPLSLLVLPLVTKGALVGAIVLENRAVSGAFTERRVEVLRLLSTQAAISIENARLFDQTTTLATAYERFVPKQFLEQLGKSSILEVKRGDFVQREMSVLFSDIRSFASLAERLGPVETFQFVNDHLGRMEPSITRHGGFIDKYIGDAIMALFPGDADKAVAAGIDMLRAVREANEQASRGPGSLSPTAIGVGINTGLLSLGTVGGERRLDGTVISDAVNLSSRLEGLTKEYGAPLLVSEFTWAKVSSPTRFRGRRIDRVRVKGRIEPVDVIEVFEHEDHEAVARKLATRGDFEAGVSHWLAGDKRAAAQSFASVLAADPGDRVALRFARRCDGEKLMVAAEGEHG